MSNISKYLAQILSAVYGKDVRQSIHDSIECCYTDVQNGVTLAETAAGKANSAATSSETRTSDVITALNASVNTAIGNANGATTAANMAASNANTKASAAQTAADNANIAKEACDKAVSELPSTIESYFASLGLCVVNGKLCQEVKRDG